MAFALLLHIVTTRFTIFKVAWTMSVATALNEPLELLLQHGQQKCGHKIKN